MLRKPGGVLAGYCWAWVACRVSEGVSEVNFGMEMGRLCLCV